MIPCGGISGFWIDYDKNIIIILFGIHNREIFIPLGMLVT